ncbi:hypothetical protein FSP39_020254 [Pinctada imbricata]|uniref:L-Fucosyltransferase n=1 Tax=Pinctada imbricata TaxID=66713 RepID=A0AA89BUP0_PINIB|nr:hypothetical protein FSP39_020254 [Pinctada imbricata]
MTGRLGNQMFIFGTSYLLAKQANMTLLISYEGEMIYKTFTDVFENRRIVYRDTKRICRVFRKHRRRTNKQVIDPTLLKFFLLQNSSVLFFSYLQSYKNFENHENEVRSLYKFNAEVRRVAYTELLDARLSAYPDKKYKDVTYIGVHIRRGDILNSKYGYNTATQSFIRKAMNYFHKKFRNALFIVRSNGIGWTAKTIKLLRRKFSYLRIVIPIKKYDSVTDLAMLASCNHSIITVGTFSWWSGWLTGGQVIYYKKAALPGSKYEAFLNEGTFYPPKWIAIA